MIVGGVEHFEAILIVVVSKQVLKAPTVTQLLLYVHGFYTANQRARNFTAPRLT